MNPSNPAGDFEALARQYWSAWAEMAHKPDAGTSALPGWKEGLAWWSQLAGQGRDGIDAAVERMNSQAGNWFGSMQNLAAGFAGRDAAPADIAQAWRKAMGGAEGNAVADMFKRMSGADAHGMDAWLAQAQPFLAGLRGETNSWLGMPTFGLAREHQERQQKLVKAQIDYQQRTSDYNGQLARAAKGAFERFERKLAERSEPGRQIESARALFDVWIDAAEEAWAEVALSPEFRSVYGELVNSQMRLRSGVQAEIEQVAALFGLPTRSELNGSHRKLAQLEREVRALKRQLEALDPARASEAYSQEFDEPEAAPAPRARAPARPAVKPKAAPVKKSAPAKKRAQPARAATSVSRKPLLPQVIAPRAIAAPAPRASAKARNKAR